MNINVSFVGGTSAAISDVSEKSVKYISNWYRDKSDTTTFTWVTPKKTLFLRKENITCIEVEHD